MRHHGPGVCGPAQLPSGNPDGDGFCVDFGTCPEVFDPRQEGADGDEAGDPCDIWRTLPRNDDTLDCSNPVNLQPSIIRPPGRYDRFRVFMGSIPGFEKGTRVTSGKNRIVDTFWTPSRKKGESACKEAPAVVPNSPVLYVRVQGENRDLAKSNPGRLVSSGLVQATIQP